MLNTSSATEIFSRLRSHCHMERDSRAGDSKGLALSGAQVHAGSAGEEGGWCSG